MSVPRRAREESARGSCQDPKKPKETHDSYTRNRKLYPSLEAVTLGGKTEQIQRRKYKLQCLVLEWRKSMAKVAAAWVPAEAP